MLIFIDMGIKNGCRHPFVFLFLYAGRLIAVSYTHLDVYKRQVFRAPTIS